MSRATAARAAEERVDRQQRLRDRISEVEAALVIAEAQLDDAQTEHDQASGELETLRAQVAAAERHHAGAVGRLTAAGNARDQLRGELQSTRRRLEMAEIVRRARE